MTNYLFEDSEWTVPKIEKTWAVINEIARSKFGLDYYEPQIQILSADQVLAGYSSHFLPIMYSHWSFGKTYIQQSQAYKHNQTWLPYEIVINTDPCICYLVENNTMVLQCLTLCHAAAGHAHFFKNNYCFQQWTDPKGIIDYLIFAREYVKLCEEKYSEGAVEMILDACHALQYHSVDKFKRPRSIKTEEKEERQRLWKEYAETLFNEEWMTIPHYNHRKEQKEVQAIIRKLNSKRRRLPEENILYFIEKNSPILKPWQRELVRIVRKISQYFYPQMQTKVMNEGFASFMHYELMTELYNTGHLNEGSYLEFLEHHTAVLNQPSYIYAKSLNPYVVGFSVFADIKRMCLKSTEEDKLYFPDLEGKDPYKTILDIVANYRDESFIAQFLSPKVVRDLKLFVAHDEEKSKHVEISETSDLDSFESLRHKLSLAYDMDSYIPRLDVVNVDWEKTRELVLKYYALNNKELVFEDMKETLSCIETLWGYPIRISNQYNEFSESKE